MCGERGQWTGHFHGRMISVRGLLAYAKATNDARLKEFVRAAYECGRNPGMARMGYFPACVASGTNNDTLCETCAIADMVALAIQLSDLGIGDYWDDVDGYVRNQLVEQQRVNRKVPGNVQGEAKDWVIGSYIGSFCGGAVPTSIASGPAACCTGNGSLALYYVWEGIVRGSKSNAQVNLLLNRASPWLDVNSYLPYEGKVIIHNKTANRVSVRIPRWVDRKAVRSAINGQSATPWWLNNYLVFENLGEKDKITIEFPMVEEDVTYTIAKGVIWTGTEAWDQAALNAKPRQYQCHFSGNTLVSISPHDEGELHPIYQREGYKQDKAPMKKVTRYISSCTTPVN